MKQAVNESDEVLAALAAALPRQKRRITRLKRALQKASGCLCISLERKLELQDQVRRAEEALRVMRRDIFDAEDAAVAAIETGRADCFERFALHFDRAAKAISMKVASRSFA